ncbi:CDP-glycerol glycerophosphotransferase family protein [Vagococcus xieshaowenii]|uniref:Glycosyltransferase n=1 Tax=Vagococcus xieshaowenii TaxID=2562451 RepID=A0AAJ5EDM6_9ENTE|nr:CDP-glycerol glycerophosphotransferase family protein [Vagococcus xieshaowenii]QCA29263.1 glycosyltransferase [Vagococcus xieshaowenii]TFZ39843.1 glycosyltransferase [Vagococcus xieshaowenii]
MSKLSIIVPIYNVSNYLRECLESLLVQGITDYEVIMVDDGSIDNSFEIAQEFAKEYPNFFAYTKKNQGLGHSRNFGFEKSTGNYITFVDSDDIIIKNSYAEMLEVIEETKSDFIIGHVRRFNSTKQYASGLHNKVFHENLRGVHISEHPELIYDTTAWNKIYRRDFWIENNFQFPEGMLYEDIPVTIPSHIAAKKVDVITKVIYLWRARDKGDNSITQQRSNIDNLRDRLKAIQMVREYIKENNVDNKIKEIFDFKNLNMDFPIYWHHIINGKKDYNELLINYIQDYIQDVDSNVVMELPVMNRLKYRLLENNQVDEFIDITRKHNKKEIDWKPYLEHGRYVYKFPYIDVLNTEEQYIGDELNLITRIEKVEWQSSSKLFVSGFTYIYKIDSDKLSKMSLVAKLVKEDGEVVKIIDKNVRLTVRKDITTLRGVRVKSKNPLKRRNNYKYSGYELVIDFDELMKDLLPEDDYYIEFTLSDGVVSRSKLLHSPVAGYITRPKNRIISGYNITPKYSKKYELMVNVTKSDIVVKDIRTEGSKVTVMGTANSSLTQFNPVLYTDFYTRKNLNKKITINPNNIVQQGNNFELEFNLEEITEFVNQSRIEKYDVLIDFDTPQVSLEVKKQNAVYSYLENKQIRLDYTLDNHLKFAISNYIAYICSADYKNKKLLLELKIHEQFINNSAIESVKFSLENSPTRRFQYAPKKYKLVDDYYFFIFEVPLIDHKKLVMSNKQYLLSLRTEVDTPQGKKRININEIYFVTGQKDNYKTTFNKYRFELYHQANSPKAYFMQASFWSKLDNGPRRQAVWREILYKGLRKLPTKNIAVYETYWGREFSCNPKAIYEYMQENQPKVKNVVILNDNFYPVAGNAETVKKNSWKYFYYLARAKYLFNNVNFPDFYKKREDAIEVQTMHGTPLKKLGLDAPGEIKGSYKKTYINKNNRWNYLMVPSDYVAEVSKSAFGYKNEILPVGYPRNDVLLKDNNPENIESLRKKYRLPADKKIILYAPTWRVVGNFSLALDMERMKKELGDEYFIIVKLHHFSTPNFNFDSMKDFARLMPNSSDIRELYLVSDVLITDYSSVMFDFSLLNKPMMFYVYDYEKYKNELRGFYLDFEEEVPGKLSYTTEHLIESLSDLETYCKESEERYKSFQEKFNQYDNGTASEQLINKIMK